MLLLDQKMLLVGGGAVVSAADYSSANREVGGSSLTVNTDDQLG